MNEIHIGDAVKSLRKMAGLSQAELARDICTQAQISKIETNNESPSAITLYRIAKKLGVDMNYFFDVVDTPRLDYIQEVKQLIEQLKKNRDYQGLKDVVETELQNPLFQSKENRQYLLWHQAICFHYLRDESEKAIDHLYQALHLTYAHNKSFYNETEIEILNSLAIILKDMERYEESEKIFRKCLNMFYYTSNYDITIRIRLIYGLAKLLTDIGKYMESKVLCQEGIDLCKKYEVLYLFGELQYQYGSNCARLGEKEVANVAFDRAIKIFEIQDNLPFVEMVGSLRKELLKNVE